MIPIDWTGDVQYEWARHFFKEVQRPPMCFDIPSVGTPLVETRNDLVKLAIEAGAEWMIFLDSDVIPPNDGLIKLSQSPYAVTSGLYWARKPEVLGPAAWMKTPEGAMSPVAPKQASRYVAIDLTGAGMLRVHKSVFEKVPEPWFRWTKVKGPFNPQTGKYEDIPGGSSEDLYFCNKARENNFSIMLDTEVKCEHIVRMKITQEGTFTTTKL